MAEVVTDPEALEVWEALSFRFDSETLDQWMDGEPRILTAGVDYPKKWPWVTLKTRLRQNASARKGKLRIGRLTDTQTQIQFFPRPIREILAQEAVEAEAAADRESMEVETPEA